MAVQQHAIYQNRCCNGVFWIHNEKLMCFMFWVYTFCQLTPHVLRCTCVLIFHPCLDIHVCYSCLSFDIDMTSCLSSNIYPCLYPDGHTSEREGETTQGQCQPSGPAESESSTGKPTHGGLLSGTGEGGAPQCGGWVGGAVRLMPPVMYFTYMHVHTYTFLHSSN